jgi:hypothetical protein
VTPAPTELRAFLLFACLATLGESARAEPLRASLVVTRDDGARDCPDSGSLAARVEHVAGKRLFDPDALGGDTWVQVSFAREFGGLRAVISAHGRREGTRSLDDVGPACASLTDAVAITLAILLDPTNVRNDESATHVAVAEPSPLSRTRRAADSTRIVGATSGTADVPARDASRRSSKASEYPVFGVEASAGASFSVLSRVVPLAEAGLRVRLAKLVSLAGGGGLLGTDRVAYAGGYIDLTLVYAYARACTPLLSGARTVLEVCAEPMLMALNGSGSEYANPHARWAFWPSLAAVVQAYGAVTPSTFWSLRVLALAPLIRQGFSVRRDGLPDQAFRVSAVGGMLSFGLDVEL